MAAPDYRAFLEAATRTMQMGMVIAEVPSGRVLFADEETELVLGRNAREAKTIFDYDAYVAFDARGRRVPFEAWPIARAMRGDTIVGEQLELEHDGKRRTIRIDASPVRDAAGEIVAAIATYHDITEARRAHASASFLAEAGARLQHLRSELGLQEIAELAVPRIADWCYIHVRAGDELRLVGIAHADPARLAAARAHRPGPIPPNSSVARVLAGGPPELAHDIDDAQLARVEASPEQLARIREVGYRSAAVAPLVVRDGVIGAITLATATAGRRLESCDLELLCELARRASVALDNTRLLAAEQEARRLAEAASERTRRLQQLTARLSAALSTDEVAAVIVGAAREALDADAGRVWLCNAKGDALELCRSADTSTFAELDRFRCIPLDRAMPVCQAVRRAELMVFGSRAEYEAAYPGVMPATPFRAWAVVPFVRDERGVGVVTFSFAAERAFSADDRELMSAMIGQASLALERCRLLEAERRAHDDAEAARRRERQLHAIAAQLSSALTPAAAAEIVCREVKRTLQAATVVATLVDRGNVEIIATVGVRDDVLLARAARVPLDARMPLAEAVRTSDIVWCEDRHELAARYPELEYVWGPKDLHAWGAAPFTFEGYTSGSLGVVFREPHALRDEERQLLVAIGQLAAQALERARLFGALQVREDQLRLALSAGRAGTWRVDVPKMSTVRDPSYVALLGYADRTPAPLEDETIHPDDRAAARACLARTLETGAPYEAVVRLRFGDGTYRWTRSHGRLIRNERDAPVALTGVTFDIEEEKQASLRAEAEALERARLLDELRARQEELVAAAAAAHAADRRKDEFLAMLGHELRNPLAPIATALDLMQLKGEAMQRERDVIRRQVDHLARLIDDLLDISRITRGKIQLAREVVELGAVIAKAIEMASPLFEKREHALAIDVPRLGLLVDADPTRLAQVFQNLLTNAAKYTEPGGRIAISARGEGERVVVIVRDSGIGIPPELLPRMFEPFVQGARALDRSQGGLGIGLAIAHSLCVMHGGGIEAGSDGPGRGSTFTVTLPRATRRAVVTVRPPSRLERATTPRRVLVVDDNVDAALGLEELLGRLGHHAAIAHDGPRALELAAAFAPEIAVLDIGLPVMDGYELARRLRAAFAGRRVRLIALTGYGQDADRARARDAGFDYHLVKPIGIDALASLLGE